MEEVTRLIEQALAGSRHPLAPSMRTKDPETIAYSLLVVLEEAFGKERPEFKWKSHKPLANLCGQLGRLVLVGSLENKETRKRNIDRVKLGFILIDALCADGILSYDRAKVEEGKRSRDKYYLKVTPGSEDSFEDLMNLVDAPGNTIPVYTRPQFESPLPFIRFNNPEAGELVRNANPAARKYFTKDHAPKVFDVINQHMSVSYNINREVLDVYNQCQEDPIFTFSNKIDLDETQLEGLERERDKVLEIAEMVGDRRFWEYMFYDSRGRIYSSAVYLTHAGSKLSKSLFLYNEKKPIGSDGWFWLLVHTANCFGEDKLTIDARFDYANDKLDSWLEIAKDPVNNKLWQQADSPFEFLAAITEIKNAYQNAGGVYEYESGLPVAWDATCSGLQVLSALSRDEKSGELCNLTESDVRGDYYKMIADYVWKDCVYNDAEERTFNTITEEMRIRELEVRNALNSGNKVRINKAFESKKEYFDKNKDSIFASAKVYWGLLRRKRRSICKRPCMTYFYSCGSKTMAKAMLKDHGADAAFKGLNYYYAKWMADNIYKACRDLMDKPTALMDLFIELGLEAYKDGKDFELDAPVTNFKMMQYYRKDKTEGVFLFPKGRDKIKLRVTVGEKEVLDKNKVSSATSPNVVHMLDSQIVAGVLLKAAYTVSCIHDSFSTHAADAGKLYYDCRDVFVDIFSRDILEELVPNAHMKVTYGKLDITEVYENDYNFS